MSGVDELKAEIKKLSAKATNMKMNLHDLSEELPVNWTNIMSVAQETHGRLCGVGGGAQKAQGTRGGVMSEFKTRGRLALYAALPHRH